MEGSYTSQNGVVYGSWLNPVLNPGNFSSAYIQTVGGQIGADTGETVSNAVVQQIGGMSKVGVGDITNAISLQVSPQTIGDNNYSIQITGGNSAVQADDAMWMFGTLDDAGLYYDGTDMVCDPKLVGSGNFHVLGAIVADDGLTIGSYTLSAPTSANQVLQATSANAATWSTDVTGLTSLVVDNITIDGNSITSNTGTVSFVTSVDAGGVLIANDNNHAMLTLRGVATSQIGLGDAGSDIIGRLIYRHTDDSLGIDVNGAEAIRILSTGNVGIAISAPTEKLEVNGAVKANKLIIDEITIDGSTITKADSTSSLYIASTVTTVGADDYAIYKTFTVDADRCHGEYWNVTLSPGDAENSRGRHVNLVTDTTKGTIDWAIGDYMNLTKTGAGAITNMAAYYVPALSGATDVFAFLCYNDIIVSAVNRGLLLGPAGDQSYIYSDGTDLIVDPSFDMSGARLYVNDADIYTETGYGHQTDQYRIGEYATDRFEFRGERNDNNGAIWDWYPRFVGTGDGTDYNWHYLWADDTANYEFMRSGYDGTGNYILCSTFTDGSGTHHPIRLQHSGNDVMVLSAGGVFIPSGRELKFKPDLQVTSVKHCAANEWNDGAQTGTMKIRQGWAISNVMDHTVVRGYNYSGNNEGPWELRFGGYDYTNGPQWVAQGCTVLGNPPFQSVRCGFEAGYPIILLGLDGQTAGETATVWNYPWVEIESVSAPHTFGSGDIDDVGTVWSFDISNDEATDWSGITGEEAVPMNLAPGVSIEDQGDGTVEVLINGKSMKLDGVVDELYRWVADGYDITVNIGEGSFNCGAALTPSYAYGANVYWEGVTVNETSLATSNIDGSASALITGLERIDFDLTLPSGNTTTVGDFIIVKTTSGGSNPELLKGTHEVITWNGTSNVATLRVARRDGVTTLPSGAITVDTCTVVKSKFYFSASHGMKVTGAYHCGNWNNLVFHGSALYEGIWLLNGAAITLKPNFGTSEWAVNLHAQGGAAIYADYTSHSYCDSFILFAVNNSSISCRYGSIINGARTTGISAQGGSTVSAYELESYCAGGTYLVQSYKGSFVDCENGIFNGALTAGSTAFYATSGGGIDSSGTTTDAATDRGTEGAPGGNGAYHVY